VEAGRAEAVEEAVAGGRAAAAVAADVAAQGTKNWPRFSPESRR